MLLAGDIGGTKTKLAVYSKERGPRKPLVEETFPSRDYDGLEAIAREFLDQVDIEVDRASFGEAGNLALKVMTTGGVYLGSGIPPRILPALEQERFLEAFRKKGRHSDLMDRIPVHVILRPEVAILGVACHGLGLSGAGDAVIDDA
ncbi:MAG: glucokinase [Anaerolineae bacterium]